VGDQGFNFTQPPRRERKTFEPPPWERDQYESDAQAPRTTEEQELPLSEPEGEPQPAVEPAEMPKDSGEKHEALGEKQIAAMFVDLRAEEPPAMSDVWKVALAAAAVVGVVGIVLIIWAISALATAGKTGQVGWFSGLVLLFFGAGFFGVGLWLAERTLRQRGVL